MIIILPATYDDGVRHREATMAVRGMVRRDFINLSPEVVQNVRGNGADARALYGWLTSVDEVHQLPGFTERKDHLEAAAIVKAIAGDRARWIDVFVIGTDVPDLTDHEAVERWLSS